MKLGAELLKVHRNYQPALASVHPLIKSAAHITGGGLLDNVARVLPASCDAIINPSSWKTPAIFEILQRGGKVPISEMYQVFNMGIGMTLILSEANVDKVIRLTRGRVIGTIVAGTGSVRIAS